MQVGKLLNTMLHNKCVKLVSTNSTDRVVSHYYCTTGVSQQIYLVDLNTSRFLSVNISIHFNLNTFLIDFPFGILSLYYS